MPKFVVYVERSVPQWRKVVVECDREEDIGSPDKRDEIFEGACQLDGWEYADDCPSSQRATKIAVVGPTDEDAELEINNPEAPDA